jgi:hypothetical protein
MTIVPKALFAWLKAQIPVVGDVMYGIGISVAAAFVVEAINGRVNKATLIMVTLSIMMILFGAKLRERK